MSLRGDMTDGPLASKGFASIVGWKPAAMQPLYFPNKTPAKRHLRGAAALLLLGAVFSGTLASSSVTSSTSEQDHELKVFVAIYERGPAYQADKGLFQQPSVREHIQHHEALGERLIAAGPLRTHQEDRSVGIVVFMEKSESDAQQWLHSDPAIVTQVLRANVRQWGVSRVRGYHRD